jgi:hypothetical protein
MSSDLAYGRDDARQPWHQLTEILRAAPLLHIVVLSLSTIMSCFYREPLAAQGFLAICINLADRAKTRFELAAMPRRPRISKFFSFSNVEATVCLQKMTALSHLTEFSHGLLDLCPHGCASGYWGTPVAPAARSARRLMTRSGHRRCRGIRVCPHSAFMFASRMMRPYSSYCLRT